MTFLEEVALGAEYIETGSPLKDAMDQKELEGAVVLLNSIAEIVYEPFMAIEEKLDKITEALNEMDI